MNRRRGDCARLNVKEAQVLVVVQFKLYHYQVLLRVKPSGYCWANSRVDDKTKKPKLELPKQEQRLELEIDPVWDKLRTDSRFQALLERIGSSRFAAERETSPVIIVHGFVPRLIARVEFISGIS